LDEAACVLLAQLLERHGFSARVQPAADVISAKSLKIDALDAPLVCLSYFGVVGSPAHVRYLIRRLRRVMPNARFLAAFWMLAGPRSRQTSARGLAVCRRKRDARLPRPGVTPSLRCCR
jgi:hypothetical protein